MQIVCISNATFSGGETLAEKLAEKLDYACIGRKELIEAATREGIHVGKLEMSMIKPPIFNERMALDKEHYLAFTASYLCDRAAEGPVVYHGRAGHLLLSGVGHVLRVRVVASEEQRIDNAMRELNVERKKARRFIEDVDEDLRRWVHSMYGLSWEDVNQYDMVINLEQMNIDNAATAIMGMAQLPDFKMTPASMKMMANLRLGSKVRLALARDERTHKGSFKVRADGGVVTVSYLPQDSKYADHIEDVLASVEGVTEIRATMATNNILWIQETFDHNSDTYGEIVEIATKWNAAVQLVRLEPSNGNGAPAGRTAGGDGAKATQEASGDYNAPGGIEDDVEEEAPCEDSGMTETLRELARVGRSGGGHAVCGGGRKILASLDRSSPYTLVVIGDVGLDKGHAARLRMVRELQSFMSDHIKAPVVTADELKSQYLFSKRDVARFVVFLAVVLLLYFVVFTNQEAVLEFLLAKWGDGGMVAHGIVSVAVFIIVPIVAYSYGTVAKSLMKLIKME